MPEPTTPVMVGRAISVRQPWARCIAAGVKTVENRTRSTSYRGWLAIHASRAPDVPADSDPRVLRMFGPDARVGAAAGAVVAVARLVDVHRADSGCCQPWGDREVFHLVLADAVALDRPLHTRGALGLPWRLPGDVIVELTTMLAEQHATVGGSSA